MVLVMLLILTSCSLGSPYHLDKSKPVQLTLWHHFIGDQKTAFDTLVAQFNSTEGRDLGIAVTAVSMDNTGDIGDKLLKAANHEIGAPQLPDIATAYPGTALTLYQKGLLAKLAPYFSSKELSAYVDNFLREGYVNNNSGLIILPIAKSVEVLYINDTSYQAFLKDYNEKNPKNKLNEGLLATYDGIEKTADCYYQWTDEKTPQTLGDGKALFGMDSPSNFSIVGYRQLGDDFFIASGKSYRINSGSTAFNRIWSSYTVPMTKGLYAAKSLYRSQDTQTGDILMYTGSTAGATFFPKTVIYSDNTKQNIDLKVLPYPTFSGSHKTVAQQGAGMIVVKSSAQKEYAASVFLKWFTEPARNTEFSVKTGYLPVTKTALEKELPAELAKLKNNADYENIYKVMAASLQMTKGYEFYSYKPFDNSDTLRYNFEDNLIKFAADANKKYQSEIKAGQTSEKALEDYAGESARRSFIQEAAGE